MIKKSGQQQCAPAPAFGVADAIRRRGYALKCRIVCVCVLTMVVIAGLVAAMEIEQRQAALDRARGDAANLAAAFGALVRPAMDDVSGAMDEVLATANHHARMMGALGAAALALPLLMVLMLNREITRRVDREIALEMESEKLRTANATLTAQHRQLLGTSAELSAQRLMLQQAIGELELSRNRAEEASRAKSLFLANMSHELRTPLNAIIGFAEIIRDRVLGDDLARYCGCAADIQLSGVHLLSIINGVLDVAQIKAGKFALRERVVPLSGLIAGCLPTVTPQAANGDVAVIVDVPEDAAALHCDETRFKQIVINLLSNAIKFTPRGGRVVVRADHGEDGGIRLSVSDTGIGMTAAEMEAALELFGQVDNRLARRFQGTGLGLPLAVQLAELHGARLELASTPEIGTVVTVHIPPGRVIRSRPARRLPLDCDRRRAHRSPVKSEVVIYSAQERFRTRAIDMSASGVRLERVAGLHAGDRLQVEIGQCTSEGIVVWLNHSHMGMKFTGRDALRPEPRRAA